MNANVLGECVDLLLEPVVLFEEHVLLVSHLNQQGLYPRETPRDWLHDGGYDRRNSSTTTLVSIRFGHPGTHSPIGSVIFYSAHDRMQAPRYPTGANETDHYFIAEPRRKG